MLLKFKYNFNFNTSFNKIKTLNNIFKMDDYQFSKAEEKQMRLRAKFDTGFLYDVLDDIHD